MLLTSQEAVETISCPFFRYVVNEVDVLNHGTHPIYIHQGCMGCACIQWRWHDPEYKTKELYGTTGSFPMAIGKVEMPKEERRGFCGVGGPPTVHIHYEPHVSAPSS